MAIQTIPKRCPQCKQTFPATAEFFHRNKCFKDGLANYCKNCRKLNQRQYHHNHSSQHKQYCKRYYQIHRHQMVHYQRQRRKTLKGYLRKLWHDMHARCYNPKFKQYKDWGGRGIKVKFACFKDFYYYVVKELKADPRGFSIDRINNNGHYEPGNIRFVSRAQNNQNRGRKANPSP